MRSTHGRALIAECLLFFCRCVHVCVSKFELRLWVCLCIQIYLYACVRARGYGVTVALEKC